MSSDVSCRKGVTRRGFLTVAVSAIVAGVVAGIGAYYAGTLAAPAEVTKEVTKTIERTTTVTAPPLTTTVTKTATTTVTPTTTPPPTTPSTKRSIRIGFTLSKSGFAATGSWTLHETQYVLWQEQVNARGGIYVREFGTRLPVEFIWYDDQSDIESLIRLYKKLMAEDKVDFILAPWSTGFNFAIYPMCETYGYPLLTSTCTSLELLKMKAPYFYGVLPQSDRLIPAYVEFFKSMRDKYGIRNIALAYNDSDHGVENGVYMYDLMVEDKGFNIVLYKKYPTNATDLTPLLTEAKAVNADAFIAWSYPDDTVLLIKQAIASGFNPKIFYTSVGLGMPPILKGFGAAVNGCMNYLTWHPTFPFPGTKEYADAYTKRWDMSPGVLGGPISYTCCQILEQAIEKAGSLDREKVKKVLDTETFQTISGNIKFTRSPVGEEGARLNYVTPTPMGQIQNVEYHIIWPDELATAKPIVPKPPWPT